MPRSLGPVGGACRAPLEVRSSLPSGNVHASRSFEPKNVCSSRPVWCGREGVAHAFYFIASTILSRDTVPGHARSRGSPRPIEDLKTRVLEAAGGGAAKPGRSPGLRHGTTAAGVDHVTARPEADAGMAAYVADTRPNECSE
jgi:hypothetical protein